ncbi:hypothetical protein ABMA70_01070 [Halobacteriovorax sp. XZX-3]|uniref:hypothetical protein n=1 Tax=unclassified Halobacteriovorax TaxID=2639665 RepID=UPI003721178E
MSKNIPKSDNEALHFLHDLLNHTHGLKLYLESRHGQMEQASLNLIYNEVQALENQISSQFKRLKDTDSYSVESLIDTCKRQFEIYQLKVDLKVSIFQSDLAPIEFSCDGQIFERLIKNISKNLYLWSSPKSMIECHISEVDEKIQLTFSNEINEHTDLEQQSNGIGLLSMKRLASENGITFQSYLENEKWITIILINKIGHIKQNIAC